MTRTRPEPRRAGTVPMKVVVESSQARRLPFFAQTMTDAFDCLVQDSAIQLTWKEPLRIRSMEISVPMLGAAEEARRRDTGLPNAAIPFRPDHGQEILYDQGTNPQPGYPAIGRLKGLAELRGIERALSAV